MKATTEKSKTSKTEKTKYFEGKYSQYVEISGGSAMMDLKFVAKARSLEEARFYMTGIEVEEEFIVATDGRRLHIAKNVLQIAPGSYDLIKNTPKTIGIARVREPEGRFPNWRRVLPEGEPIFTGVLNPFESPASKKFTGREYFSFLRKLPKNAFANISYLGDLFAVSSETVWTCKVFLHGDGHCFDFTSGDLRAVVMGMVVDE